MTAAVRGRLLEDNPFADLPGTVGGNRERFRFVTRDEAAAVLAACPDWIWRLRFALARFGGLRVPSEIDGLRLQDIDWERGRLTVTSPKTAHREGRGTRQLPIFPELVPHLREAFEQAPAGAVYVIDPGQRQPNLRTHLHRIIRRAGLEPWPKVWQNLRSTRETELMERFPQHVVCAWIGNSPRVAATHYLQVTDAHFARAVEPTEKAVQKAVHDPVQQGHAAKRTETQVPEACESQNEAISGVSRDVQGDAAKCIEGEGTEKWAVLDSNQ